MDFAFESRVLPRTRSWGFTLIELLVVIAIIAILAALLLPSLAKAKAQGQAAACLSNLHQINLGVIMYADDNKQVFPSPATWWQAGPYRNRLGQVCGSEWLLPDQKTPNTPAPMIETYVKNPLIWVCPTRRLGLTFTTAPGDFDPSLTGFLSYGFNDLGCFCLCNPAGGSDDGMAVPTPEFKLTSATRPSQLVCITEVSGSPNPNECDGNPGNAGIEGDAAWLDGEWALNSGTAGAGNNGRLQTAYGKHDNMVNVMYVDGHAAPSLISRLTWGSFWGVYGTGGIWPALPNGEKWDTAIGTTSMDTQVWSNQQE